MGIGELLWDLLPGGPRLGGALTNFAVFCARLGNRATLVSSVGDDDYGRAARTILTQPNLDLEQLQEDRAHPTGTVEVSFSADKQPRYIIHRNVAWDFIRLTPDLLEVARAADAVCFGTLAQRHEVSRSTIQSFVEATAQGCLRVFDVNLRMPDCTPEVLHWSMAHATIIKLSDEELPQVFSLLDELGQASTRCRRVLRPRPTRCLENSPAANWWRRRWDPMDACSPPVKAHLGIRDFPSRWLIPSAPATLSPPAWYTPTCAEGPCLRWRRSAIFAAATWLRSRELLHCCLQLDRTRRGLAEHDREQRMNRRIFLVSSGAFCATLGNALRAFAQAALPAALREKLMRDPFRPQFHLLPRANWQNDPCAPRFFRGQYHMFFQYNPGAAVWGDMHWAHAVSPDLIHWKHMPVALSPTPGSYDAFGCFTGSVLPGADVPTILYTGVTRSSPETIRGEGLREVQCLATSTDPDLRTGRSWISQCWKALRLVCR